MEKGWLFILNRGSNDQKHLSVLNYIGMNIKYVNKIMTKNKPRFSREMISQEKSSLIGNQYSSIILSLGSLRSKYNTIQES